MGETFGLRERLIAIARANNLADRARARGASCRLEEMLAEEAMSSETRKITDRGLSNIFTGKSSNPRANSIDAIRAILATKLKLKKLPNDWDRLERSELLKELGLPADIKLELEAPLQTSDLKPFHALAKVAFNAALRAKVEEKYSGYYSVYRRHAREHARKVVEELLWIGFINGAELPQAVLFTKEGHQVGEIAPGSMAWSIQFIAPRADETDRTGNDALRLERRDVEQLPAFNGIRIRHSRSGANVAYRTILVQHPRDDETIVRNPNLTDLKSVGEKFVREHDEGSSVQKIMFGLLENDGANHGDSERGVMHSRDLDIEIHLKGFDPTRFDV